MTRRWPTAVLRSECADPALAGLLALELPPPADWTWSAGGLSVSLADLGLGVADAVMFDGGQLSALAGALS